MHTQVIMGVFFWSALALFACWIVVELSEVIGKARRDAATRARLGLDERPGASAWEERMRIDAAENKEGAGAARRG
jgi:hypothetical protein